jgi:hypothetical protein
MLMNGRSEAEADQWIEQSCADAESKLTGALVRKYGFKRGNDAMARAKTQLKARVAERYAQQQKTISQQNQGVIANEDGWFLKKSNQSCTALMTEQDFLGNTSTVVGLVPVPAKGPDKYLLLLMFPTKSTQQVAMGGTYPSNIKLSVALFRSIGAERVQVGPFDAAIGTTMKDGVELAQLFVVVDGQTVRRLSGHEALYIQSIGTRLLFPPFEMGALGSALDLLKRCP